MLSVYSTSGGILGVLLHVLWTLIWLNKPNTLVFVRGRWMSRICSVILHLLTALTELFFNIICACRQIDLLGH
jgi:hypothetical protein